MKVPLPCYLALSPFVAVMATSFTDIVVVLGRLRNAPGLQPMPPNVVLNGRALWLQGLGEAPG